MAPSRKSANQTATDPIVLRKAVKVIEVSEPMSHRPTLSDVHISDAKESHPTVVSPLRRQTAEPAPPPNKDQLFQMLSSMSKQLENQRMEMIRLCKVAAYKKEAITHVQKHFLKQI